MQLNALELTSFAGGRFLLPVEAEKIIVKGLCWDSREVSVGDLYLAIPGSRVDGHDFVADCISKGASACLIEHALDDRQMESIAGSNAALILVDSVIGALERIAAAWRQKAGATVIALTGSSGKTTTKNLMSRVLSSFGPTIATIGNQNNELGVPATLLRIDPETRFAVVEMGMRGLHQLELLCAFAQPDMALVTNVGTSHMELLGSRENIARAKAEPFASLREGGVAFIDSSDEYANCLRDFGNTRRPEIEEVFFDGSGVDPQSYPIDIRPKVYASDVQVNDRGCASFVLHLPNGQAECSLGIAGLHNVHNACAAAAVGWKLGMDAHRIAGALAGAQAVAGRQQVLCASCGATVIDDTYNANPDSMKASLAMFASMDVEGRRFAVLGDMGELGDFTEAGHALVGECAVGAKVDRLYCVGALSKGIAAAALRAGMPEDAVWHTEDVGLLISRLKDELGQGDAVLVKASHSMALERIVEGLID